MVHVAAEGVTSRRRILMAYCGGRAIALGDRMSETPRNRARASVACPSSATSRTASRGARWPGIPTHADLSLSALVLG